MPRRVIAPLCIALACFAFAAALSVTAPEILRFGPLRDPVVSAVLAAKRAMLPQGAVMDIPLDWRQTNWGGGSCQYASVVSHLRHHGYFAEAKWVRANHRGRAGIANARAIFDRFGLPYRYTTDGDERLLEWAVAHGHGACIYYKPNHAINLIGLDEQYAYLLDNNHTSHQQKKGHYERIPRETFLYNWKHRYAGGAITLTTPPLPTSTLIDSPSF